MRWIAIGCLSVVLFDTLGAFAARVFTFEYGYLLPISLAIYATFAFLAARAERSMLAGMLAGASLALADATAGWAISWAIGPGALAEGDRTAGTVIAIGATVIAAGAVIGLLAGLLHRLPVGGESKAAEEGASDAKAPEGDG